MCKIKPSETDYKPCTIIKGDLAALEGFGAKCSYARLTVDICEDIHRRWWASRRSAVLAIFPSTARILSPIVRTPRCLIQPLTSTNKGVCYRF